VERTITRAIELIHAHPEFHRIDINFDHDGTHLAQFDTRKMERVIYNLLLNACQAAQVAGGHVAVAVTENEDNLNVRVIDDGVGVDPSVRDSLFHPFVSHGKENGTGLGLTIAQKVIQDHHGSLHLESSVRGRTVMLMVLPRRCSSLSLQDGSTEGASKHSPA
jgi:signal transduction histidine kinase